MVNTLKMGSIWLLLVASLTSGCSTVSNWLADDVYELPPTELVEFNAEIEPDILWSTDTGKGFGDTYNKLAAWVQNEAVIAVDYQGRVSSYDINTGRIQWSTDLDVVISTGAGGGDDLVLIGTQEGGVLALEQATGQVRWKQTLSSEILAPPKASLGIVVVRTADGRMTGLAARDGEILWNYQRSVPLLSLRGASAPILADDMVIAGYDNGKLITLSIKDGTVIWEQSVAIPSGRTELDRLVDIDSDPVITNNTIYVVAYNGRVAALALDAGRVLWSRDLSSRTGLDVAPGNAVYVSDDSDNIWSIQDGSGNALWRQTKLLRRDITAPAIAGKYIVVGDFEGYVHWLSRQDGHFVARTNISDGPISTKPILVNGLILIMTDDGKLTAFRVPQ